MKADFFRRLVPTAIFAYGHKSWPSRHLSRRKKLRRKMRERIDKHAACWYNMDRVLVFPAAGG